MVKKSYHFDSRVTNYNYYLAIVMYKLHQTIVSN